MFNIKMMSLSFSTILVFQKIYELDDIHYTPIRHTVISRKIK
ncbi:MAG: hypothetical protein RIN55_05035 [Tissierellaceae bacterium]|nr:hypothetical protein [Tissierellaceae bacterium]